MSFVKVSVVVPIYNAENFIQDTLDMLCRSTLEDIEILAINDGSTDNTLSILENYSQIDSRIKVIDKPNGGIYDARNRGLEEARGEYICFCDQDDVVEPRMYEIIYKKLTDLHSDVGICSYGRIVDGKKTPFCTVKDAILKDEEIKDECFLPLIFNRSTLYESKLNIKISNTIWKCMISSSLIKKNKIQFRKFVDFEDDRLFLLEVLARAKKICLISDLLYFWRVNLRSESHAPSYVEDLYKKDILYQNAQIDLMRLIGCEDKFLQLFEKFNSADRYTRLVWNEVYNENTTSKNKKTIIGKIYEEPLFKEIILYEKYFPRNMFARKVVCKFLKGHHVFMAYEFCNIYTKIRHVFQGQIFWTKLEKTVAG